jgi:hypothetical protein
LGTAACAGFFQEAKLQKSAFGGPFFKRPLSYLRIVPTKAGGVNKYLNYFAALRGGRKNIYLARPRI